MSKSLTPTIRRALAFGFAQPAFWSTLGTTRMGYEIQTEPQVASSGALIRSMTYNEFLEHSGEDSHVEWVKGRAIPMSPVSEPHERVRGFLYSLFRHFVEAHGLGRIYSEPFQMKTGPDLPGRAPDIFFVANERLDRLRTLYLDGPADLVVEIISPGSRATDRGDKFYEYEHGVPEYWLLDPERKQAEFYIRNQDGFYKPAVLANDGIYRSQVLSGLWIRLDWLWQPLPPPILEVLKDWKLL